MLGPRTWEALEKLSSLEEVPDFGKWRAPPNWFAAFWRAIQARLALLNHYTGRIDASPPSLFKTSSALKKFGANITALARACGHPSLKPHPSYGWVPLLFDQQRMFTLLSTNKIRSLLTNQLKAHSNPDVLACQILKLELWLEGHEVGDFHLTAHSLDAAVGTDYSTLADAFKDTGTEEPTVEPVSTMELSPDTHLADEDGEQGPLAVLDREVSTILGIPGIEQIIHDTVNAVKKTTFFLWDGIKHTIQWLHARIKEGVEKLVGLIRSGTEIGKLAATHIGRWLHNRGSDLLRGVQRAGQVIVDLIRGIQVPRAAPIAAVKIDPGFHLQMIIDEKAPVDVMNQVARRMKQVVEWMRNSLWIVDRFIGLLRMVTKMGTPIGWLRCVALLVRMGAGIIRVASTLPAIASVQEGAVQGAV